MGNVHALAHRVTALSIACLSSVALSLVFLAGSNCSFLDLHALPDRSLMTPDGLEMVGTQFASIGVKCENDFFDPEDRMWHQSRIFLITSTTLGCLTTALAWAVSTCVPPGKKNWRALSILSSLTAVLEVPIFMLFESDACTMDITRQSCSLGMGSYFLIASVVLWVFVTLWTQFLDPPKWSDELNAWKANNREIIIKDADGTEEATLEEPEPPSDFAKKGIFVTSTNHNGLAIWTTSSHKKSTVDDDAISSVSSGSEKGKDDVEVGNHRRQKENQENGSVLKAALSTKDKLMACQPIALQPAKDKLTACQPIAPQPVRRANSSVGNIDSFYTGGTSELTRPGKKTMRNAALVDSDYSYMTDRDPGVHVTIVCPDGTKKKTNLGHLGNCFDGEMMPGTNEDAEDSIKDPGPIVARSDIITEELKILPLKANAKRVPSGIPKRVPSGTPKRVPSGIPKRVPSGLSSIVSSEPGKPEVKSSDESEELTYVRDPVSILEDLVAAPQPTQYRQPTLYRQSSKKHKQ